MSSIESSSTRSEEQDWERQTGLEPGFAEGQSLVHGRYEVIRELGRGADGVVFLVQDRLRRMRVVLKSFWRAGEEGGGAEESRESFLLLTRLQHPSLPVLLDWGRDERRRVYFTKAYIEGTPGNQVAGQLAPDEVAALAYQLGETLGLLHRANYCHGDIKPHNMLIRQDNYETPEVTLIDFGLIFRLDQKVSGLRGTPRYMAPELLGGEAPSEATDTYALGATLYHLLYGVAPYEHLGTGSTLPSPSRSILRDAAMDAELIDQILNDDPDHPPMGWPSPQDEGSRRAVQVLSPLLRDLMSRDPRQRAAAFRAMLERLAPWAPPSVETNLSAFVGRQAQIERLSDWMEDSLAASNSAPPALLLQGARGIGKRRLLRLLLQDLQGQDVLLLEHSPPDPRVDTILEDLTRQLLISAPERLGGQQTELLGELALGQVEPARRSGSEEGRRERLLHHLMEVGREVPIVLVVQDLHAGHASLQTTQMIANHLIADRTRPEQRARVILVALCHLDDAPCEELQLLQQRLKVVTLGPLQPEDVKEFVERALPPEAQPSDARPLWELTGGVPLRLMEVARYLLEASRRGQKPTVEVMRQAADMRHALTERMSHLSVPAQAVLLTLGHLHHPFTRAHLQKLLPEFMLTPSLFQVLLREGLLVTLRPGTPVLGQAERAFRLPSRITEECAQSLSGESFPPISLLLQRFVDLLQEVEAEYPGTVEPLDLLRWARRAHDLPLLAARGHKIGQRYRRGSYHQRALQAWGLTLEGMDLLLQSGKTSTVTYKQRDRLCLQYMELALEQDKPAEAEQLGEEMLPRLLVHLPWGEALGEDLAEARSLEEILALDWQGALAGLPGSEGPNIAGQIGLVSLLLALQKASHQRGRQGPSLWYAWHLCGMMAQGHCKASQWVLFLRTLANNLWRTPQREHVQGLMERLMARPNFLRELEVEARVDLLNLYAGLLETAGQHSTAELVERYERAMQEGIKEGTSSFAVARAMTNLARLLIWSGELQVARYYVRKGLQLLEAQGQSSARYGLIRSLADVHQRAGQPYAGLQASEEAYRTAISSGRKDLEARAGLSLLHHYGEFGLKDYAARLYQQIITGARYQGRWEPPLQYLQQLLSWEEVEEAEALLTRCQEELKDQALVGLLVPMMHLIKARLALLRARTSDKPQEEHQAALREAAQALILSRDQVEKALRAYTLRALIETYLGMRGLSDAVLRLDQLEELIRENDLRQERPYALYLRGQIALAYGRRAETNRYFQRARDRLEELMAEMPQAYREGYLKTPARQRIMEAADRHEVTERGHMVDGMRRVMNIVQMLLRRPERRAPETLNEVLDQIIHFTKAERGILFRLLEVDPREELNALDATEIAQDWESPGPSQRWRVVVSGARGFGQQDLDNKRVRASRTVIRRVLEHRQAVISADTTEDIRFSQSGSIANMKMRSILAIPLLMDQKINGVVYLDSPYGQQFSDTEMELLEVLGNQLGPVVEAAHEREHVQVVSETFPRVIGRSPRLLEVLEAAHKVAHTNVSVLILGETGTGKDLLAKGLHEASPRVHLPFVAVNCAALPESLIESELFGHVRGAFTGADRDKPGVFEQAHRGSLFLDEIGDLPLSAQAKLLRVLQEGTLRRVGDKQDRPVDVRVLAATHWDLAELVREKRFREDLYYRLNVITLRLPPLRERPEDIPTLVRFFFGLFSERFELSLPPPSPDLLRAIEQFPWPGNIRQLKNALQQAMLMCNQGELTIDAMKSAAGAVEESKVAALLHARAALPAAPPDAPEAAPVAAPEALAPQLTPAAPPSPPLTPAPWPALATQRPWSASWGPSWPALLSPPSPTTWPGAPPTWPGAPPTYTYAPQPPWQAQPPSWAPPQRQSDAPPAPTQAAAPPQSYMEARAQHRRQLALDALSHANGNKAEAARLLGVTRRAFYRILGDPNG
jgi:transcriptional regulator with GAF, ATPase, and Fis domain/serine/threonine protein kinase